MPPKSVIIFDFGGVLIDWNPRHLYRKVFDDDDEMEHFLETVCTEAWQGRQNADGTWPAAIAERVAKFPKHRSLIEIYRSRWPEMLGGALDGTVAILHELREKTERIYGLTNWSAEMFPHARNRFEFIDLFDGVVVSGEIGVMKPSPEIFHHLFDTYDVDPAEALFIDDSLVNIEAGRALGLNGHHFTSADALRSHLSRFDYL